MSDFQRALTETVHDLRSQNLQLVWLFLSLENSAFVNEAVLQGFTYHHANEKGIQMTLPLVHGAFIPGYATQLVL
jgi:hypothetical protein